MAHRKGRFFRHRLQDSAFASGSTEHGVGQTAGLGRGQAQGFIHGCVVGDARVKELEETDKTEVLVQESEDEPTTTPKEQVQQDPFNQSIDETLAAQNEKRKEHLKAFNHKFMHQLQRVDDLEKQPAYKRQGLDLETDLPDQPSRTTLDTDTNDDIQMRSNNSFLHDNVD